MRRSRSPARVAWPLTLLTAAVSVVLQASLVDRIDADGLFRLDLPLLVVVAVAARSRVDDAALVGFTTGLFADLFHTDPFGQQSLSYCLAALLVVSAVARLGPLDGRRGAWRPSRRAALVRRTKPAAAMALVAGTATIVVGLVTASVRFATVPAWPAGEDLIASVPLGSVAGSMIGIQLMLRLVAGWRLADRHDLSRYHPGAGRGVAAGAAPPVSSPPLGHLGPPTSPASRL